MRKKTKTDLLCALLDVDSETAHAVCRVYGDHRHTIRTYRPGLSEPIFRFLEDGNMEEPTLCMTVEEATEGVKDRSFPICLTVGVAMQLFGISSAEFADEPWM